MKPLKLFGPKSLCWGAAALALVTVINAAPAQAEEEIIFGISAPAGSLQQLTSAEFTRLANKRLAGKATVKLFDSAQLGKDKELMQKLKLGSVHIALPSSIMSSVADEFALFDMPFLVKDRAHLARIENEVFWSDVAPTAEAKGYQVLALWENGIRHISNNLRPINTPADLKGAKIRTPKSKWRVKMFTEWGANPTPMSFSEVFVALQTGVIEGQENPYTNIWSAKLSEVQKYLSVTGHVYSPAYPTMGKAVYDKMDPAIRDVLEQTARDVAVWARFTGAAGDADFQEKLVTAGMTMNVADRASFVSASKPIYAEFASEVPAGQDLIDAALALAE
ncbi:TRAP transporter substrate-binding protein [Pelagibius litoralis]|uniref:TRAP transporter substrate-binding protein n=1 Tax=Pelagibius litoralis TaxID=374515 RepID=A0A967CBP5_9PROT|nr:TRAP transporter substrate-binding protein [Pelagibius litoralis]NIA68503.1 TRAP transporter substrate-binding protein [Pelagibius litoralis]